MSATPYIACLALVALAACGPKVDGPRHAVNTARIVGDIKADEVHWNADLRSGDPAKVAAHYAPGAILMVPGVAPMVGQPAIKAGFAHSMDDPGFALTFVSDKVDVAASGDIAASRGSFAITASDPKTKALTTTKGAFVTVYKPQADGTWKAIWDINTPNAEPPVITAPKDPAH